MSAPPPLSSAQNGLERALATPPQPLDDASIALCVRATGKCRVRCHGPSCQLDVIRTHCLSFPSRSVGELHAPRSIILAPNSSNLDSTAHTALGTQVARTEILRTGSCVSLRRVRENKMACRQRQAQGAWYLEASLICTGRRES